MTLHEEQAVTTLSQFVSPPLDLGRRWSKVSSLLLPQYWQENLSLKKKIIKFREDELNHKDIAYEKGATKKGLYSILDKIIKTGSKIAINISEKI